MPPKHLFLILLAVAIWGFNFVAIRWGLDEMPPLLLSALRFSFTALPAIFFLPRPQVPLRLVIGYGMLGFGLQFGLLFMGMRLGMHAGLSSVVMQLQVFFTMGLAAWLFAERPKTHQILGALIAFLGVSVIAFAQEMLATLLGLVCVVGGAFCWGMANVFIKKINQHAHAPVNMLGLVAWGSVFAAALLWCASLALEGPQMIANSLSHLTHKGWFSIVFNAYPTTLFAFAVWAWLLRIYPTAQIVPFTLLVPVTGLGSAVLFLDEAMQPWKIACGVLVLAGLALNQFGGRLAWFKR